MRHVSLDHGSPAPIRGRGERRDVPEDVGGSLIDSLTYYFVVHLIPTLLVLGLAWAVFRAIGVSVVWRRDE